MADRLLVLVDRASVREVRDGLGVNHMGAYPQGHVVGKLASFQNIAPDFDFT